MNDDLAYVRERLEQYRAYAQEGDRHDSDMRVRAYVGNALSKAQLRLGEDLDQPTRALLEAVLMRCMFTDQVFIRKFEHGDLDAATVAALVHSDRTLVELGDQVARPMRWLYVDSSSGSIATSMRAARRSRSLRPRCVAGRRSCASASARLHG